MTTQQIFGYENAKTIKGLPLGYVTAIRYLAPSREAGRVSVCANAGACEAVCLYEAGRGIFAKTKAARIAKTHDRLDNRADHLLRASHEINRADLKAMLSGLKLAVRLNGTSDLPSDAIELAKHHTAVQFYDYTKLATWKRDLPSNYHLTLSYDPITVPKNDCMLALKSGVNVAVVFDIEKGRDLPAEWFGRAVIDGDEHDLRFLDPKGVVVGLRAKGPAKGSAFAVKVGGA